MSSGSIIGLAIFSGVAFGLLCNKLDRIEARLLEVDSRLALLAEELGEKISHQGGDDGIHGRPERREEKTQNSLEPAPEGPGLQGVRAAKREEAR